MTSLTSWSWVWGNFEIFEYFPGLDNDLPDELTVASDISPHHVLIMDMIEAAKTLVTLGWNIWCDEAMSEDVFIMKTQWVDHFNTRTIINTQHQRIEQECYQKNEDHLLMFWGHEK